MLERVIKSALTVSLCLNPIVLSSIVTLSTSKLPPLIAPLVEIAPDISILVNPSSIEPTVNAPTVANVDEPLIGA